MKARNYILIGLILVILDQITKFLFQNKTYLFKDIGIEYTTNTGAAFGILKGSNLILTIISLFIIIFLFTYYRKAASFEKPGLILLLSGTIGNLIDRVAFGYVRDFIAVYIWPNFNLADSYNVIGVIILLI